MYPCTLCQTICENKQLFLKHIRDFHVWESRLKCPFCPSQLTYNSLRNHLNIYHNLVAAREQNDTVDDGPGEVDLDDNDYNIPVPVESEDEEDNDEEEAADVITIPQEDFPIDPQLSPMEQMLKNCKSFRDKCFEKWLKFSSHPDATVKCASLSCEFMLNAALDVIEICKPFLGEQNATLVLNSINNAIQPLQTQKRRMQHLKSQGYFVEPKPYTIDYENVNIRTGEGVHLDQRKATVSMPSIKESLLAVLNNEELSNVLVMPSDFTNVTQMTHPFCGTRTQDCLAVSFTFFSLVIIFILLY